MVRLRSLVLLTLLFVVFSTLLGCSSYNVRFLYPRENRSDYFNERPELSLFVAEPEDLRSRTEREGRGMFITQHFPADDKLDQPPSRIVMRALLQDLNQTRVANLVRNPDNADFVLHSQLLSMTTELKRPVGAWAVPLATGVMVGSLSSLGGDGGVSHGVKTGFVGLVLGTLLPAPANVKSQVEVRLELRERETNEVVWTSTCTGEYARKIRMAMSSREDRKIAEDFLPKALKRANACAVGQLYAFLQERSAPTGEANGR